MNFQIRLLAAVLYWFRSLPLGPRLRATNFEQSEKQ